MCMIALVILYIIIYIYITVTVCIHTQHKNNTHMHRSHTYIYMMQEDCDMISHALTNYCFVLIVLKSVCLAHDTQWGL